MAGCYFSFVFSFRQSLFPLRLPRSTRHHLARPIFDPILICIYRRQNQWECLILVFEDRDMRDPELLNFPGKF